MSENKYIEEKYDSLVVGCYKCFNNLPITQSNEQKRLWSVVVWIDEWVNDMCYNSSYISTS